MPSLNADVVALIVCLALPEDAFERVRVKRLLTVVSRDWRHITRSIGRHVAAVEADELPAFAERVSPFSVCRPLELRRLHLRVVGQHISDVTWLLVHDAIAGCARTLEHLAVAMPDWVGRLADTSPVASALLCVSLVSFDFASTGELDIELLAAIVAAWPKLNSLRLEATVNGWSYLLPRPTRLRDVEPTPRTALRHLTLTDFRGPTLALDVLLTACAADLRSITLGSRLYTDQQHQMGDIILAHGLHITSIDIHNGLRPLSLKSLKHLRHLSLRSLSDAWGFCLARTLAAAAETPIESLGVPTRAASAVEAAIRDARLPRLRTLALYFHPPMPAPSDAEIASLEALCSLRGIEVVSA